MLPATAPSRPAISDSQRPDFGPSGYLPERASKRARKIVLRAPLGLQWIVGALVVGLAVIVAGVWWLTADDAPAAPWEPVGPVEDITSGRVLREHDALLVGNGRIRAFADATERDLTYCPESRRLEAPDGGVWSLTGRGLGGTASLEEHPTRIHDGVLYLDPTHTASAPPPSDDPAEPACHD